MNQEGGFIKIRVQSAEELYKCHLVLSKSGTHLHEFRTDHGDKRLAVFKGVLVSQVMSVSEPSPAVARISVVIPVYNEATTLVPLLTELVRELDRHAPQAWEILVVDDGSKDATPSMTTATGVKLIRHETRKGSGAARRSGSKAASGELIAWIDGDGTYPVAALIAALCIVHDADQVVGVRSIDYGRLRFLRQAVKNTTARIAGWLWRTWIPDLNSGLRVFRRQSLYQWIDQLPDGFSCTTTATLEALNRKQRLVYLPITYRARSAVSQSKFHPIWDTYRLWRVVWRCWLRRRTQESDLI